MEILILHGWGQNKTLWKNNIEQLGSIAKTTAIDLPGFGKEKLISSNWGIPEYANWVEKYVSKNKLKNVVLIGHSMGGKIASFIASKNPSWLKRLVLVAAPSIRRPSATTKIKIFLFKIAKTLIPNNFRRKLYSEEYNRAQSSGMGDIFKKIVNSDQTDTVKKIKKPTLLLWGENDDSVPLKIGKELERLIPNSKLVVLKETGHQVHLENPYLFYAEVKKFVSNN